MRRVQLGEFKAGDVIPGTRYRVIGLLGRGGMGLVYDVEHLELGKRFVLKALLSDLAAREDFVARLRNEQRALGRLQHPNIVAVTDAGVTTTNLPYFVMERLEGETLGARLRRLHRLPVVEAVMLARGVLEGLSAAHEIGVVHRDIKPQNIFLVSGRFPKILDFGVAKVASAGSAITARGVAIGTPRYMSPEQIRGESVDGRSDLYAVGLMLFECITGAGPFDDIFDSKEILVAHAGKTAPRLGDRSSGVTRELEALVASLLTKNPSDRPPTARATVAALVAVLGRYGGGANLEAPTPAASYSTVTRPLILPGGDPGALTTRPDGVAAREAPTIANSGTAHGTTQLVTPAPYGDAGGGDGRRAPGGTLYDPSSRALTVAHPNFVVPIDAMRTERIEAVPLSVPLDEPTHTRVPLTPSDGTPSLVPVRVQGPRAPRTRPAALFLAGAAAVVAIGVGYFVLRGGGAESRPAAMPVVESARSVSDRHSAAPLPAAAPSTTENDAARVLLPTAAPPATSAPPKTLHPGRQTHSLAKQPTEQSASEPSAPPAGSAPSERRLPALSAKPPPGLPQSGL